MEKILNALIQEFEISIIKASCKFVGITDIAYLIAAQFQLVCFHLVHFDPDSCITIHDRQSKLKNKGN